MLGIALVKVTRSPFNYSNQVVDFQFVWPTVYLSNARPATLFAWQNTFPLALAALHISSMPIHGFLNEKQSWAKGSETQCRTTDK